ncbi:MAG: LysR family transcriptional regulator [Asticcacaulis sp.]
MLKHRRLLAFDAVIRHKSALKAADFAHMTQPAVSGAIRALENEVSAQLFERSAHGMIPTRSGHAFAARVSQALDYLKSAETILAARRPDRQRVPLHRLISESQMRALNAVMEGGGFSQGARLLGLSQPSIHRAARELETLTGVTLWRNGADATPEAHMLARHFGLYQAELRLALDELKEIQGIIEGGLSIGALPLARADWLPEAVARTLSDYPDARIRIIDGPYDEQLSALRHGRIDFILGALRDPVPAADIEQELLFDDPLTIVVRNAHPFAKNFDSDRDKLTPEQLGALSWILPREATPARDNFNRFMRTKGLQPPMRVIECSSLVAIRALLLRTDHAALLSARQVRHELDTGLLKIMGPPLTGSLRAIGLTTRKGFRPTTLQTAVLSHIRQGALQMARPLAT